jgi:hypothetical protein
MVGIAIPLALSSLWQGPPACRELAWDAHLWAEERFALSRFHLPAALTTCSLNVHTQIIQYRSYLIHSFLIYTSHVLAAVPVAGAALAEGARRDPQRQTPMGLY